MISENLQHTNAEVRKNIVFCIVEMRLVGGDKVFGPIFNKLPEGQKKLVQIYLSKKGIAEPSREERGGSLT